VKHIYEHFSQGSYDMIIGMGGGSVLDTAKIISVLRTNDMSVEDMLGMDKIGHSGIPTVLIPTTAGTGSEVTPNAIVTFPDKELKIGIVSRYLLPELVILDPMVTLSLPKFITASTGMDAFTHAIESYISNKANPISNMFALESIRLISANILRTYEQGDDLLAREAMLLGSMYGGMALSCAGTAAVHAMAYPIGGKFNVPHGVANSMLLPHVMRFNMDAVTSKLAQVATAMNIHIRADETELDAAEKVVLNIEEWTAALEIPQDLAIYGVKKADVPELALAASQVTRLMDNNPKRMEISDIETVYHRLLLSRIGV
jgi:alcohol dehydrogenase class IV